MGISRSYQPKGKWKAQSALTTAQVALTTDKSAATTHALTATGISRFSVPEGWVSFEMRFRGVASNADSNVINIYAMKGTDHYRLIATLTLTTGTQIYSTGNLFVDTIVETSAFDWISEVKVHSPAGNDIGTIALNTHGYTDFLVIATTKGSTSVIPEVSRAA